MTVKPLGNGQYTGLVADTKPTNTSINSEYWETDTGKVYRYNGTAWRLRNAIPQGTSVYRDNDASNRYYAIDPNGNIISDSTTAQTVVSAAVAVKGFIRFFPAEYQISSTLNLESETHLKLMPNTLFSVPNASTHAVFRLYSGQASDVKNDVIIDGGKFLEAGSTPQRNWTIVKFDVDNTGGGTNDGGVYHCQIKNFYTKYCGKAVHLKTTGIVQGGWINDNYFENIYADYPRNLVHFEAAAQPILAAGTHVNTFVHCGCQDLSDPAPGYPLEIGWKDIGGWNNTFIGCNVWDIIPATSSAIPCTISAATANNTGAHNTTFINCDMFRAPVDWEIVHDKGEHTTIIGGINTGGAYSGYMPDPFIKKTGMWMGVGTSGTNAVGVGLLDAFAVTPTSVNVSIIMDANGLAKRLDTTSTISTQIGFNGSLVTARGFNPYFKMKLKLNSLTDCHFFFGFCSGASPPVLTGDDPLNGIEGFGIGFSSTSGVSATNYLKYTNDGTTTTEVANTGIAATTNPTTLYVAAYDSLSGFRLRIGTNDAGVLHTSAIPAQYTQLRPYAGICNTTGASKTFDGYMAYLKQDGV